MFKRWILLSCMVAYPLSAETAEGHFESKESDLKGDIELSQGYRVDRNTWSNSGFHGKPDVLSELVGKDIKIYQTRLSTRWSFHDYMARLQLGIGDVISGRMRDSDYLKDGRHEEFSRSIAKIKGSYTWDGRISFGKTFELHESCTITPLIGYLWQAEKLRQRHGRQKRFFGLAGSAKIRGLNSTYKSIWDAPFIGALATHKLNDRTELLAEYNFFAAVHYIGKGHWNLRERHFRTESSRHRGFGNMGLIGISYKLFNNCFLKGEYQYTRLTAKGGTIEVVADKTLRRAEGAKAPFRKASLTSSEVRLSLDYAF